MITTKFFLKPGIALLALLQIASCNFAQNRVKGSGHVVKEDRQISNFRQLKVEGSMDVELTQASATTAKVEADDNIAPLIELVSEGDKLIVRIKKGYNINTHNNMVVYLTTPELNEASLAGSGDVELKGKFNAKDEIKLNLSGSGDLKGGEVDAPSVKANIAGSGDLSVKGQTKEVELSIAGSGNFHGDELLAEDVSVKIAGSGDASVYASVKLEAKIAGSGNVNYKGTPQVTTKIAGSGEVRKR
jgi:hypothetical protein